MAVGTTFPAFIICIIICATCPVFHITRCLLNSQNNIIKLFFWGMPLTAVVSMYINGIHEFEHWAYTLPITIVPTLCVFTYCFKYIEALLPEIGNLLLRIFFILKRIFSLNTYPIQ